MFGTSMLRFFVLFLQSIMTKISERLQRVSDLLQSLIAALYSKVLGRDLDKNRLYLSHFSPKVRCDILGEKFFVFAVAVRFN